MAHSLYNLVTGAVEDKSDFIHVRRHQNPVGVAVIPHRGTYVPEISWKHYLNQHAPFLPDNDGWDFPEDTLYKLGFTVIKYDLTRNGMDLNRPNGPIKDPTLQGIIRQQAFDKTPLLITQYAPSVKSLLIEAYYEHPIDVIEAEMEWMRDVRGHAFLLNLHAMKPQPPRTRESVEMKTRPPFDIGLATRIGPQATLASLLQEQLTYYALSSLDGQISVATTPVTIDDPYSGADDLTQMFTQPAKNYFALLLEIREDLRPQEAADFAWTAALRESIEKFGGIERRRI